MRTPKQEYMAYYNNEPMTRFPNLATDVNMIFSSGFHERPATSGTDWMGCQWIYDSVNACTVLDVSKPLVLEDIEDWKEVVNLPDLKSQDWAAIAKADGVDALDPNRANFFISEQGLFERLHSLMGFENAMCAMLTNPEDVGELFDALTDIKIQMFEILAEHYHVDVIDYCDDWGTQNDLFFSAELWRELIKPRLKRMIDRCHELGVKFELHSCGKIDRLLEDIAEVGPDSLQCMAIVDIPAAQKIFGTKIGLNITPDHQKYSALDSIGQLTEEKLIALLDAEILEHSASGRYYPFFWPTNDWWAPAFMMEIERMGKVIYSAEK